MQNHNYSSPGCYFVTICTKNRDELLGEIVDTSGFPTMNLSTLGVILEKKITAFENRYPHIQILKYVIMPNHFHMIVRIRSHPDKVYLPSGANNELSKFISVLKRSCNHEYMGNIWQRSYNDHIIRDKNEYLKISKYIENNTIHWYNDCFYNAN